jgi:hypothetical protein
MEPIERGIELGLASGYTRVLAPSERSIPGRELLGVCRAHRRVALALGVCTAGCKPNLGEGSFGVVCTPV